MRDRLIELIKEANDVVRRNGFEFNANVMADYLLANGVIVLPVNVGDKVYVIEGARPYIKERLITEVRIRDYETYLYSFGFGYPKKNIGINVFLSREAAAKALQKWGAE